MANQPAIGASLSKSGCDASAGMEPASTQVAPTEGMGDQVPPVQKDYSVALEILQRVIADKKAMRERNAKLPWHEKVATEERVRDACRAARASMARHKSLLVRRDMETQAVSEVRGIQKTIEDS